MSAGDPAQPLITWTPVVIFGFVYITCALVIFFLLIVLVVWRRNFFPLKAHHAGLVVVKIMGIGWTTFYLYFAWFNPYASGIFPAKVIQITFAIFGAWFYVGPTTHSIWRVFHTFLYSKLLVQYHHFQHSNTVQDAERLRRIIYFFKYLNSSYAITCSIVVHLIAHLAVLVLYAKNGFNPNAPSAIANIFIFVVIGYHAVMQAVVVVLMILIRVQENFGIISSVIVHVVVEIILFAGVIASMIFSLHRKYEVLHYIQLLTNMIMFLEAVGIVGNTVVRTFFWKAQTNDEHSNVSLFEAIMADEEMKPLFKQFAIHDLSVENVLFYEEVKRLESSRQVFRDATEVYIHFLHRSGCYAINVHEDLVKEYKNYLEAANDESCILASAHKILFVVTPELHEMVNRFALLESCKRWIQKREALDKAQQELGWNELNPV